MNIHFAAIRADGGYIVCTIGLVARLVKSGLEPVESLAVAGVRILAGLYRDVGSVNDVEVKAFIKHSAV